jgi:hypothetical protein
MKVLIDLFFLKKPIPVVQFAFLLNVAASLIAPLF